MRIGTAVQSPGGSIEVSVLINDVPQQLYRRPSDGKIFVAGRPGEVYKLRVRNLLSQRAEVLNTVDGMNTLREELGDLELSKGLVFPAKHESCFTGWRLNNEETRQFIFGSPAGSVADMAVQTTENTGVIGFGVYKERVWRPGKSGQSLHYGRLSSSLPPAGGGASPAEGVTTIASNNAQADVTEAAVAMASPSPGLATHIGEKQYDPVRPTTFSRSGTPDVLVIGYDTEEALRDIMGAPEPNPFPGMGITGYDRYAPCI